MLYYQRDFTELSDRFFGISGNLPVSEDRLITEKLFITFTAVNYPVIIHIRTFIHRDFPAEAVTVKKLCSETA